MATQKKIDVVTELSEKISRAKSMVFADYTGIKHKQLEELRKSLKKTNGEFTVTKNKLLERALGERASTVMSELKSSTATLFAYEDEVAPLKELLKFFKTATKGITKGGLLGNTYINTTQVMELSKLPGRDILLGRLVGQLNAPIQGLHRSLHWNLNTLVWALDAIKNKKN